MGMIISDTEEPVTNAPDTTIDDPPLTPGLASAGVPDTDPGANNGQLNPATDQTNDEVAPSTIMSEPDADILSDTPGRLVRDESIPLENATEDQQLDLQPDENASQDVNHSEILDPGPSLVIDGESNKTGDSQSDGNITGNDKGKLFSFTPLALHSWIATWASIISRYTSVLSFLQHKTSACLQVADNTPLPNFLTQPVLVMNHKGERVRRRWTWWAEGYISSFTRVHGFPFPFFFLYIQVFFLRPSNLTNNHQIQAMSTNLRPTHRCL